ncbi:hypothetical protein ACF068_20145 [Streptomyces sp. NPDC016309]|uniref:hypothetical protein n=1 Tax=Streptomyces sp. NPDC016309 TaxID=3364965 RepID=UPI0036FF2AD6
MHGYLQVSFIGWRFAEPKDELKPTFASALQSTPTQVDWSFTTGKNWMILPTRLLEESGPDTRDFNEAVARITQSDQDFCAATVADLEIILAAIAAAGPDKND